MSAHHSPNERLAVLEQKISHMEEELDKMSAKAVPRTQMSHLREKS